MKQKNTSKKLKNIKILQETNVLKAGRRTGRYKTAVWQDRLDCPDKQISGSQPGAPGAPKQDFRGY